jgi:hypothetical protein
MTPEEATGLTAATGPLLLKDPEDSNRIPGSQINLARRHARGFRTPLALERSTQDASAFTFELNVPRFVAVIFGPRWRDGPSIRATRRQEQREGTEKGETNHCKKTASSELLAIEDATKGPLAFSSPGTIPWHVTILAALRTNRLPVRLAGAPTQESEGGGHDNEKTQTHAGKLADQTREARLRIADFSLPSPVDHQVRTRKNRRSELRRSESLWPLSCRLIQRG